MKHLSTLVLISILFLSVFVSIKGMTQASVSNNKAAVAVFCGDICK